MRYRMIRMPLDVYENLVKKQRRLEEHARNITGRSTRIPRTNVMRLAFNKTWFNLSNQEIMQLTKFGRKKKEVLYA